MACKCIVTYINMQPHYIIDHCQYMYTQNQLYKGAWWKQVLIGWAKPRTKTVEPGTMIVCKCTRILQLLIIGPATAGLPDLFRRPCYNILN